MSKPKLYMVFDVESVGLHGEGYAVGWVVVDSEGRHIAGASYACDPDRAKGDEDGRKWVTENAPMPTYGYNCSSPRWIRDEFWRAWDYAKKKGAVLVADCAWPVEARFLAACIDDDPKERAWGGPYPLHDVATARLAAGLDPLAKLDRLPDELPVHDPAADARQSARLFLEALNQLQK